METKVKENLMKKTKSQLSDIIIKNNEEIVDLSKEVMNGREELKLSKDTILSITAEKNMWMTKYNNAALELNRITKFNRYLEAIAVVCACVAIAIMLF